MTREEALQWLTNEKWKNANNKYKKEWNEAFDMAIEALSAEEAVWNEYEAEFTDLPDIPRYYYEKVVGKMAHEINMLKEQLESAEAVQGEWIEKYNGNGWNDFWDYTCSNCGKKYERADAVLYHANYCPNCGAKMKGGAE